MYESETAIRVRYGETDQMGYLYYGHYAQYFEVGRAESFRNLGYSYSRLEAEGIVIVVAELHCRYLRPLRYDELVTIRTSLREWPENSRMQFHAELFNPSGELVHVGVTTLVVLDRETRKKTSLPDPLLDLLRPYFFPGGT